MRPVERLRRRRCRSFCPQRACARPRSESTWSSTSCHPPSLRRSACAPVAAESAGAIDITTCPGANAPRHSARARAIVPAHGAVLRSPSSSPRRRAAHPLLQPPRPRARAPRRPIPQSGTRPPLSRERVRALTPSACAPARRRAAPARPQRLSPGARKARAHRARAPPQRPRRATPALLGRFGLTLHPDKTRRASLRRAIQSVTDWCHRHRHLSVKEQHAALTRRIPAATSVVCCCSSKRRNGPGTSGCVVASTTSVSTARGSQIFLHSFLSRVPGSRSGSGGRSHEPHPRRSRMVEISLSGSGEGSGLGVGNCPGLLDGCVLAQGPGMDVMSRPYWEPTAGSAGRIPASTGLREILFRSGPITAEPAKADLARSGSEPLQELRSRRSRTTAPSRCAG